MVANGIVMEARIIGLPIAGGRKANGFELVEAAPWSAVMALKGVVLPELGEVLEVAAPRADPLPAGSRINVVTG
jgi:hypothetical protein